MSLAGSSASSNGLTAWGIDAVIAATETTRFCPHGNIVNPVNPVVRGCGVVSHILRRCLRLAPFAHGHSVWPCRWGCVEMCGV